MKKMTRLLLTVVGVLVIFGAAAMVSVTSTRTVSEGLDTYRTHRPLFGNHVVSQFFSQSYPVHGIGFILVDYTGAGDLADVNVTIFDSESNETLGKSLISGSDIVDDTFAKVLFEDPITASSGQMRVELHAPNATQDSIIGVRYDPKQIGSIQRFEDGKVREGVYAMQVIESTPLWLLIYNKATTDPERWNMLAVAIGVATLLVILSFKPFWANRPAYVQKGIEVGLIIVLAALALNVRLYYIPQLGGLSGGDPYNYLFITQKLMDLENPFEGVKRLPGYPALLIPFHASTAIDDQIAMETISSVSAAGMLIMLAILTRTLGLPWIVQLFAPALVAFQKDFFWTSIRPEPYSLFGFLMLTALVLFFHQRNRWQQILFGIVLGYAAMTRQEGFVIAAILGLASVIQIVSRTWKLRRDSKPLEVRSSITRFLWMYIPALLLVLPFFIHNTVTFGNPIFTPYFEGERLQIVNSWPAFVDAVQATWGIVSSLWKPEWDALERYPIDVPLFALSFFGTIAWWFMFRQQVLKKYVVVSLITTVVIGLLAISILIDASESTARLNGIAPIIISAILLASPIPFILRTGFAGVLVLIVLVSQLLIPTWFHPFPKHYQQSYPLLALLLATALFAPATVSYANKIKYRIPHISALASSRFAFLIPFTLVASILFSYSKINSTIDQHNAATALDSVVFRATREAAKHEGPYGIDQPHLQFRLYFRDGYFYGGEEQSTEIKERQWLKNTGVRTMIITNANKPFSWVDPSWEELAHFKSEGRDERLYESWVYRIQQ